MNILFTWDYGADNLETLRKEGHIVNLVHESETYDKIELTDEMKACDIIVGYNFFKRYPLSEFPNVKYIQLTSVGFNHIPIDEIRARSLPIYHNVGQTRFPIGEFVMWQILSSYKSAKLFYEQQKTHTWKVHHAGEMLELCGKTVMFLGAGNIAQEVARKCKAFDAKTVALNLDTNPAPYIDEIYLIDDIDKHIGDADILVSCLPATPATFHMLNKHRFDEMKDDALLVNISRGTVIDEAALVEALGEGKFRNVCLDVFEKEPLSADSPLWDIDKVMITPHNAIESDLSYQRVFELIHKNINHFVAGEELEYPVHYERGF